MTNTQRLIQFLLTLTPCQQLKFFRLCNKISGSVDIPDTSEEIYSLANFIRLQTGGVRNMISFAKKYAMDLSKLKLVCIIKLDTLYLKISSVEKEFMLKAIRIYTLVSFLIMNK